MRFGELTFEAAALEAAGNWKYFSCFIWRRETELDDAENWAIVYTHHRDSGLLDESNAHVIEAAMKPFEGSGDVVVESHRHWAVGWIDGFSIRVFRHGKVTEAFRTYYELVARMATYPILDDTDYSNREYKATVENIADAAWRLKSDFELPEGWESEAYSWFSDHDYTAIENCDDQGGYPDEEQLRAAFDALGYKQLELV